MSPAERSPESTLLSLTLNDPVSLAVELPPRLEPPLKTLTPLVGFPPPEDGPVAMLGVVIGVVGAAGSDGRVVAGVGDELLLPESFVLGAEAVVVAGGLAEAAASSGCTGTHFAAKLGRGSGPPLEVLGSLCLRCCKVHAAKS